MTISPHLIDEFGPDSELFNPEQFAASLQGGAIIPTIRAALSAGQTVLEARFDRRENIKDIVRRRAWLIDQIAKALWVHFKFDTNEALALIGVGGYGRGELHPHSDVDLLILLSEHKTEADEESISKFVTLLWDIGLDIGHSVRTVQECADEARNDITIASNLMEARLIAGSKTLFSAMMDATGPDKMWSDKAFFKAKWHEQIVRHHKHNNTEYNLEPDIKNAPGGLRDIQMIGWVAKRHFGATRLSDLVTHGFLTQNEYDILNAGQSFLWELRWALHQINRRGENKLLFDHQRSLARLFGYEDTNANLAVEQFMKRYYRIAMAISQLNEMLLQFFDEAILRADEPTEIVTINPRFQVRNGSIEVTSERVFQQRPSALFEIFVVLANHPEIEGIRASTIRLIRDSRNLIDEKFRNDIRNVTLFIELLRSPHRLFTQLRRMKRFSILGRYIPAFGKVIGQMQYDLFHIYTVDAHTLLVIKNMRQFLLEQSQKQFPLAYSLVRDLPKLELLYIAGLYHDMAKGRGGDHSELGSDESFQFCIHHRLSKWDASLVAWLVKNHLLMSVTAQKKDVSDPEVIQEFATVVGDQIRLKYLYCLTVADICATNPNLWNGWKASLLRQLYIETKRALRRGLENPINKQEWIDEAKSSALKLLLDKTVDLKKAEAMWAGLGDDYFVRDTPSEIAWHSEAIVKHPDDGGPLVLIRETSEEQYHGATQIFVYTKDQPNLFGATVAVLDQLRLTIVDARIITSASNFSLDTYFVLEENGEPIGDDPGRIAEIHDALCNALKDSSRFPDIVQRRIPRQLKSFTVPTQVNLSLDENHQRNVLELITLDRPGLLARIGRIFMENGILLQNARIATLGERAEDVFFITDINHKPFTDKEKCEKLKLAISEQLDKVA